MRLPTVHMNGTGRRMLKEGYEKAWWAIREAENALRNIEFNARDYYVDGPEAWPEAVKEMEERFAALGKIEKDIETILESIREG